MRLATAEKLRHLQINRPPAKWQVVSIYAHDRGIASSSLWNVIVPRAYRGSVQQQPRAPHPGIAVARGAIVLGLFACDRSRRIGNERLLNEPDRR